MTSTGRSDIENVPGCRTDPDEAREKSRRQEALRRLKNQEICEILSQKEIVEGIFDMTLKTYRIAAEAQPGQFVSVYLNDSARMLPRPVSICEADPKRSVLRLVYRVTGPDTGTELLSMYEPGTRLRVTGPLGKGFPVRELKGKRVFLVGGGIGIPPLLETAKRLEGTAVSVLGYRSGAFLDKDFSRFGEVYLASEDGTCGVRGNVLDVIREKNLQADAVFACGPRPMLRALKNYALEKNMPCWISMEERMACGVGACLACVCTTSEKDEHSNVRNARVCKDGPVFLSTEVEV